jgi:hypothetical protein
MTIGGGGGSGVPGTAGGTTTFGALLTANGGAVGTPSTAQGATVLTTGRSIGGVASGGDINMQGEHGDTGVRCIWNNAAWAMGGAGGGSSLGTRRVPTLTGSTKTSEAGSFPGGGASGPAVGQNQVSVVGELGGAGVIILREYFPQWVLDAAYPPGTIREIVITTTQAYNKPVGLKFLEATVVGGGGGTGGAQATGAGQSSAAGGGGGGGTAIKTFAAADLPASVTATVGLGGGPGAIAGGQSSFLTLSAGGGGAGSVTVAAGTTHANSGQVGGGGASGGTINVLGSAGETGTRAPFGQALYAIGGGGGGSFLAPALPSYPLGGGGTLAPTSVSSPGGGSRGPANSQSQSSTVGGAGGDGVIILKEYF